MRQFGIFLGGGALLLLALGLADGQQPRGGRGGFGGGFGGFGGAPADPLALLRNPSVQKELDVDEEQLEKLPDAVRKALAGVLSDKQYKRLRQIELQQRGSAAFKDAKVQKDLNITDEQAKNIETILEDSRRETVEAFKEARGGNFQGVREKIQNLRKETDEKVMGVLSSEQRKQWKQLVGAEFKMETPRFGGFGGGDGKKRFQKKRDN